MKTEIKSLVSYCGQLFTKDFYSATHNDVISHDSFGITRLQGPQQTSLASRGKNLHYSQMLRISRRDSVLLRGADKTWMDLPFSEFKAGLDSEEQFIHSLVTTVAHLKNTVMGLEAELDMFSTQVRDLNGQLQREEAEVTHLQDKISQMQQQMLEKEREVKDMVTGIHQEYRAVIKSKNDEIKSINKIANEEA